MKPYLPLLLLAACTVVAPPARQGADSSDWYRQSFAAGAPVYAVSPADSVIAVTVRRAGLLARLGHDHVVASRAIHGFAAPDAARADIAFRADELTVDEPGLLREAGVPTRPSAQDIEGTRTNMLTHVLDAKRYTEIRLQATRVAPGRLSVAITLHGVSRSVDLPCAIETGPGQVSASGALTLRQTDFGITPFAVGGGLLAVEDEVEVRFRIVARRWDGRP
ncbi:MAG: YceI family protein [Massilia sp.]